MTTFRIRGWVGRKGNQGTTTISIAGDSFVPLYDVAVELWDKDERYDDRLGRAKTDSNGVFEIEFTDEDLRQDFPEVERLPDLFARVFRGRALLFSTEGEVMVGPQRITVEGIAWNFEALTPFPEEPLDPQDLTGDTCFFVTVDDAIAYGICLLNAWRIAPSEASPPLDIQVQDDTVDSNIQRGIVDVLPSRDQLTAIGPSSALSTTTFDGHGGSLQEIVNNVFGTVLCSSPTVDSKGFLDSLEKAFTAEEENGQITYKWNPCSYGTRIETDLGGAITGAQASLFHRAKTSLEDALKLLNKLHPLKPSADPQNTEAARATVRTEIIELMNEFGIQGGPRTQRVDSLFDVLIGNTTAGSPYETVGGQLRDLANTFGLTRSRVNTVDEEHNFSNYLIIRDYLISLRATWDTYSRDSGAGDYVGTQLVLLSQALAVVVESVRETYRIMDLYFLGPAERQSVWLDFTKARDPNITSPTEVAFLLPDNTPVTVTAAALLTPPLRVEELLSWAMRFATEEGPALATLGGKIGIAQPLASIAKKLTLLSTAASYIPASVIKNNAFRRAGVRRALRDLGVQTYQVQRLAERIKSPNTGRLLDAFDSMDDAERQRMEDILSGSGYGTGWYELG